MTSDGTNDECAQESPLTRSTVKLLESHAYFGLKPENVTIMKQNGVPAICNTQGELAVCEDGHILFKPHGHGDIHLLMHQHGVPEAWAKKQVKYVIFFQDTNGLSMHGFAPLLGVMEKFGYAFGSMAIVRRPGEKVGGICKLVRESGESLTCNVEYNQLEDVLKACTGQGDVPNAQGNSECGCGAALTRSYPGNINLLCVRLDNYREVLRESGGVVQEFVNPKYKDASRTAFKAPVRLECMMQDYPKLLLRHPAPVGFVSLPRWLCFSAVKNSDENALAQFRATGYPESFFSGEEDIYKFYRRVLRAQGVRLGSEEYDLALTQPTGLPRFPLVALSARSGLTTADIASHFGANVEIREPSVLSIDAEDLRIENFVLEGALEVRTSHGVRLTIRNCCVKNAGWAAEAVDKQDPSVENKYALRG